MCSSFCRPVELVCPGREMFRGVHKRFWMQVRPSSSSNPRTHESAASLTCSCSSNKVPSASSSPRPPFHDRGVSLQLDAALVLFLPPGLLAAAAVLGKQVDWIHGPAVVLLLAVQVLPSPGPSRSKLSSVPSIRRRVVPTCRTGRSLAQLRARHHSGTDTVLTTRGEGTQRTGPLDTHTRRWAGTMPRRTCLKRRLSKTMVSSCQSEYKPKIRSKILHNASSFASCGGLGGPRCRLELMLSSCGTKCLTPLLYDRPRAPRGASRGRCRAHSRRYQCSHHALSPGLNIGTFPETRFQRFLYSEWSVSSWSNMAHAAAMPPALATNRDFRRHSTCCIRI